MKAISGAAIRRGVLWGSAVGAIGVALAAPASAQAATRTFAVPAQGAATGIPAFARQAGIQIITPAGVARTRRTNAVRGQMSVADGLRQLLLGTGLETVDGPAGANVLVVREMAAAAATQATPQDPPASSADIVVTAQKRTERIQDVPIAISAFSGKTLDAMKIETGGDLLKSIPNVTFSKNNFAGYNFSIRGIGTKAVAASTDPAVAVAFNSSNLIVNRLFEQEFYDIERVEVLRGPQGTLYGRNATAGVVNIISNKAKLNKVEGFLKLEEGNYSTARVSGAVNLPLIEDKLAIRAAGAYTNRDGFAKNDYYGTRIDGRDLWSTRVTLSAKPFDKLNVDLIWEHFNENDDRSRTGKQLCHKDDGPTQIGGLDLIFDNPTSPRYQPQFSQGCRDGSLYSDDAYSTPNGRSLNAYEALASLGQGYVQRDANGFVVDPYAGAVQSRDLRRYSAIINPVYKAKSNVFEGNASLDVGRVQLVSQTVYNRDRYYSVQDYSRYVSNPIFATDAPAFPGDNRVLLIPNGIYTDPQLGPSDRFLAGDLIRTKSSQFSQEFRIQSSDPSSRLQFVVGGNYTHFKLNADYNVFINTLSALATGSTIFTLAQSNTCTNSFGGASTTPPGQYVPGCLYTDPNPIGTGPSDGHNYFRSVNPYRLDAYGLFGDANYALTPEFKLIGGIRLNIDKKRFDVVPSQLLLGTGSILPVFADSYGPITLAGFVDRGYPTVGQIRQSWTKPTGRAGFQWTPKVSFTDKTLFYATYSRGYKAGGANPPGPGFGTPEGGYGAAAFARGQSLTATFRPEYINSFEAGVKNTLFNGAMTLNATGFYYDYKDYQVSQIIDRSSQNENFDATVWGLEFETVINPTRNLAINANAGYERSRIKNGQQSIDVMNRTQGRAGYYVVKPFVQLPSNCVVSEAVILKENELLPDGNGLGYRICQGSGFSDTRLADPETYRDPANPGAALPTLQDLYPNGGRGFYAPLGGNELPNTPHFTANLGVQYTVPLGNDWGIIARGDVYHQSESFARVYNTIGDRLHGWENVNASLRVGNERYKFLAEIYVKNVFNTTPITDAFINSDDTGLTTNVFTLDPRIIGISLTKGF